MRHFSIIKVFRKLIFCCTQCVCIKRMCKRCKKKTYYSEEPDFTNHPIFDIETGEL